MTSIDPAQEEPKPDEHGMDWFVNEASRDGAVVFLVRGDVVGAFQITQQQKDPGHASVEWAYREGLDAPFGSGDVRGHCDVAFQGGLRISFGPFDVGWCPWASVGVGKVAYARDYATGICVTGLTTLDHEEPTDARWVYCRFPGDRGAVFVHGPEDRRPVSHLTRPPGSSSRMPTPPDDMPTPRACVTAVDGRVVLFHGDGIFGGLVLHEQSTETQTATFEWRLRRDGRGSLGDGERWVTQGSGSLDASRHAAFVEFGPFTVEWLPSVPGQGRLFWECDRELGRSLIYAATTDRSGFDGLDGLSASWVYRCFPDDPGARFVTPR